MTVRKISTASDYEELQAMGWSGCARDNDCACSDASHERDQKILREWQGMSKSEHEGLLRSAILTLERTAEELERRVDTLRAQIRIYKAELEE